MLNHLAPSLITNSILTSNNRCVPSLFRLVYAKFLATRRHTHAPKHPRYARSEEGEERWRGAARFRAELSEPEQGPVLEFEAGEALHRLLECGLSILTRVESASVRRLCARPPSWKRSPRAAPRAPARFLLSFERRFFDVILTFALQRCLDRCDYLNEDNIYLCLCICLIFFRVSLRK